MLVATRQSARACPTVRRPSANSAQGRRWARVAHQCTAALLVCDRAVGVPSTAVAWLGTLLKEWADPTRRDARPRLALLVAADVVQQRAVLAELIVTSDFDALAAHYGVQLTHQSTDGMLFRNTANGGDAIDVRVLTPLAATLLVTRQPAGARAPSAIFVCDLQRAATLQTVPFVARVLAPALTGTLEAHEPPHVCATHVVAAGRRHAATVARRLAAGTFAARPGGAPRAAARQLTRDLLNNYARALLTAEASAAVRTPVATRPRAANSRSLRNNARVALMLAGREAALDAATPRHRRRDGRPTQPAPEPPARTPSRCENSTTSSADDDDDDDDQVDAPGTRQSTLFVDTAAGLGADD